MNSAAAKQEQVPVPGDYTDIVLSSLAKELPPVLYRNHPQFQALLGITPAGMANLDAQGKGPGVKVRSGKTVGYPRKVLLAWVKARLTVEETGGTKVGQNENDEI